MLIQLGESAQKILGPPPQEHGSIFSPTLHHQTSPCCPRARAPRWRKTTA